MAAVTPSNSSCRGVQIQGALAMPLAAYHPLAVITTADAAWASMV
jgi:hypothetical protein